MSTSAWMESGVAPPARFSNAVQQARKPAKECRVVEVERCIPRWKLIETIQCLLDVRDVPISSARPQTESAAAIAGWKPARKERSASVAPPTDSGTSAISSTLKVVIDSIVAWAT